MLQQGWNELNSRKKQGLSLPFVACAGALLVAFALAIVYTAGLMMSNANNKLEEERCYQLAKSYAGVVTQELKTPGADSSFYKFVNKFLDEPSYNEYNPDEPNTLYRYTLKTSEDEQYGKIELRLRKEINEDELAGLEGEIPILSSTEAQDYGTIVTEKESATFHRHIFTVEVIANRGDLSYNYATEYYREDTYEVEFRYDGKVIVWDDSGGDKCWRYGAAITGEKCVLDPTKKIQYTYKTDKPKTSKFVPMHAEGGAP